MNMLVGCPAKIVMRDASRLWAFLNGSGPRMSSKSHGRDVFFGHHAVHLIFVTHAILHLMDVDGTQGILPP